MVAERSGALRRGTGGPQFESLRRLLNFRFDFFQDSQTLQRLFDVFNDPAEAPAWFIHKCVGVLVVMVLRNRLYKFTIK